MWTEGTKSKCNTCMYLHCDRVYFNTFRITSFITTGSHKKLETIQMHLYIHCVCCPVLDGQKEETVFYFLLWNNLPPEMMVMTFY